ncbi:MAG: hypothetical protein ACRC2V_00290 [Xenococcaceae cyanobacterium]
MTSKATPISRLASDAINVRADWRHKFDVPIGTTKRPMLLHGECRRSYRSKK